MQAPIVQASTDSEAATVEAAEPRSIETEPAAPQRRFAASALAFEYVKLDLVNVFGCVCRYSRGSSG